MRRGPLPRWALIIETVCSAQITFCNCISRERRTCIEKVSQTIFNKAWASQDVIKKFPHRTIFLINKLSIINSTSSNSIFEWLIRNTWTFLQRLNICSATSDAGDNYCVLLKRHKWVEGRLWTLLAMREAIIFQSTTAGEFVKVFSVAMANPLAQCNILIRNMWIELAEFIMRDQSSLIIIIAQIFLPSFRWCPQVFRNWIYSCVKHTVLSNDASRHSAPIHQSDMARQQKSGAIN